MSLAAKSGVARGQLGLWKRFATEKKHLQNATKQWQSNCEAVPLTDLTATRTKSSPLKNRCYWLAGLGKLEKDESAQWTRHDMSHGSMFSHVFSPGLLTRSATSSAKEAERSRTTFPRNAFEPGVSLCHTVSRCWSHSWTNTMACSRACGIATSEFGWGSGEIIPQKPYQHI